MAALGALVKFLFAVLVLSTASTVAASNYCDVELERPVSLTAPDALDRLKVAVSGNSCESSSLTVEVISESGKRIHFHEQKFTHWDTGQDNFGAVVVSAARRVFEKSIRSTEQLPSEFTCEIEEPGCVPYDRNTVSLALYTELRSRKLPMLSHSTYYEGWASWVYFADRDELVKVYEGGL